jgi:serine protease Do
MTTTDRPSPDHTSSPSPEPGRPRILGPSLVVGVLGIAVLLTGPALVRNLEYARQEAKVELASDRLSIDNPLELLNQATRDLAAKVEPSVVHVSTRGSLGSSGSGGGGFYTSSGSGWIYDLDGHVVTNAHVVAPAESIEVQLSTGEIRPATFIGADVRSDIAVVRISPERLFPAERSAELPSQGDFVFAFGSPFDFRFSMSSGIVSGLSRTAGIDELDFENFIQVDAAVNPGNSGGPLSDVSGRVIGMNTAIATGRGTNVGDGQFAGIGLAIPVRMIELVVDQLIDTGEVSKGYLGIQMIELEDLRSMRLVPPRQQRILDRFDGLGVYVSMVEEGFPADRADVRSGDILVAVDGVPVKSVDNVRAQIGLRKPKTAVELELWRWDEASGESETILVDVLLGRLDPETSHPQQARLLRQVGLGDLRTLSPELAKERSMVWSPGVLVLQSAGQSQMLSQSIEAGSIIDHVGRDAISNQEDLFARIKKAQIASRSRGGGSVVELGVKGPDGQDRRVLLRLP